MKLNVNNFNQNARLIKSIFEIFHDKFIFLSRFFFAFEDEKIKLRCEVKNFNQYFDGNGENVQGGSDPQR